jgi:hypothetical protein
VPQVKPEDACDVCAGEGTPISGRPCVCGGSGTHADEVVGLRTLLIHSEALIADYEDVLRRMGMSGGMIKQLRSLRGLPV